MTIQKAKSSSIIITPESAVGTSPNLLTANFETYDRVSGAFNTSRGDVADATITSTRQARHGRLGNVDVTGSISTLLKPGLQDTVIAGLMLSDWAIASVEVTGTDISFTAKAGSTLAEIDCGSTDVSAFVPGTAIKITGSHSVPHPFPAQISDNTPNEGQNDGIVVVSAITGNVLSVIGMPIVDEVAGETVTLLALDTIKPGTDNADEKSFTVVQRFPDIDESLLTRGAQAASGSFALTSDDSAMEASYEFMAYAQDMVKSLAIPGANVTDPTILDPICHYDCSVFVGDARFCASSFDFGLDNGMENFYCIGDEIKREQTLGVCTVTGTLATAFENGDLWRAVQNEEKSSLSLHVRDKAHEHGYLFLFPSVRFTSNDLDSESVNMSQSLPWSAAEGDLPGAKSSIIIVRY